MDLMFSNIGSTLMNATPGEFSGGTTLGAEARGLKGDSFYGQLNRAVRNGQTGQSVGEILTGTGTNADDSNLYATLDSTLSNEEGLGFIIELKRLFLSLSDGELNNLSINQEGLDSLEQLLIDAGFDPESIKDLMSELTFSLEEGAGTIPVSDFMDKLFELSQEEEDLISETMTFMPTSDVPYIHSLLGMMGIDQEKIAGMLDNASRGNRGFDLDIFIQQLSQLGETSFNSGVSYQTDGEDSAWVKLFDQLGLTSQNNTEGPLTLNQLISAFEQKQELLSGQMQNSHETNNSTLAISQSLESGKSGQELLAQLFSGLEVSTKEGETGASTDLVTTQIRDQVKADLLNQISANDAAAAAQTKGVAGKIDPAMGNMADPGRGDQQSLAEKGALFDKMSGAAQTNETSYSGTADTDAAVAATDKTSTISSMANAGVDKARQTFSSLPNHVTQQVGKSIIRAINLGEDTLRLQLKPPELGRVFMSIENNGDAMKVSIITEHQSARDILASNVNEIKTILSSSGISLERFEVDMSSDFKQSMADARAQDQSGRKKKGKAFNSGNDGEEENINNLTPLTPENDIGGSLHYVA